MNLRCHFKMRSQYPPGPADFLTDISARNEYVLNV
ncbi:MAG: hypothetical protein RL077_5721 [Verrucomicrobiota bacterium]|jgi:hypothetical protein